MRLKPLYDRVVIKPVPETEKVSPAGVIQIAEVETDALEGEVVAVGQETKWAEVGNSVLFHPAVGREVVLDGEVFRVIREGEIIAVLVAE